MDRRDRAGHAEARDSRFGSGLVRGALLTDHARRRGVFERRHPATASLRPITDTIKEWPPRGDRHRGPGGFRAGHSRLRSGADAARALPHQPRTRRVCRTNGARAWLRRRRSSRSAEEIHHRPRRVSGCEDETRPARGKIARVSTCRLRMAHAPRCKQSRRHPGRRDGSW